MIDEENNKEKTSEEIPESYFPSESTPVNVEASANDFTEYDNVFLEQNVTEAVFLFDRLFYDISPSRKYNVFPRSPSIEISRNLLTELQCVHISRLAGFMNKIAETLEKVRLQKVQKKSILANVEIKFPPDSDLIEESRKSVIRATVLQQYLSVEFIRSEKYEAQVKELEGEMVSMHEKSQKLEKEIDRLKNELRKQSTGAAGAVAHTATTTITSVKKLDKPSKVVEKPLVTKNEPILSLRSPMKTATTKRKPEDFIGKYVRKEFLGQRFFGVIAKYEEPFYTVSYIM